ncbi:prolyl oligopeptidase family serine peptidase [Aureisphaera galaxeae]|uniref:alpha/beta hydrolase family esterase n=1 Tax=Aureisphaera galaxeae TaxID=1538023 RepID=UPI002350A61F|nr:prolyl oligopeptidase family serine peptidase [Aureisphaera galaxeae]MDC8003907.1 prolyl oligopeptidase family serine peptidase [Aureisphaera galaxeae]
MMKKTLFVCFTALLGLGLLSMTPTLAEENNPKDLILKKLTWQDRERTYWLHLPPEDKMTGALPVLFHLHGGGGTGKGTPGLTYRRFNKIADREGFIVVYPDAIAKNWNDGRTENLKPENRDVDDVGFIVEIINQLKSEYSIDATKIFSTGMSNGGFMTSRLLCDRSDLFRGGAILTASISEAYLPKCDPATPVAVLVMNGTDDPLVPYEGGDIRLFKRGKSRGKIISNDDYLEFWQQKNACTGIESDVVLPDKKRRDGTTVHVRTYSNCVSGGALKFYKIVGGGHTWPGGKQYLGKRIIGNTSREINACDEIWEFFSSLD